MSANSSLLSQVKVRQSSPCSFSSAVSVAVLTATAAETCNEGRQKRIKSEGILFAMTSLGLENYAEALKIYLSKYRQVWPFFTRPAVFFAIYLDILLFVPFLTLVTTAHETRSSLR